MNAETLLGFSANDLRYQTLLAILRGEYDSVAQKSLDWDTLVQLAIKERVAPLIHAALEHSRIVIPSEARQRLANAYYQTFAANALRLALVEDVLKRFQTYDIPVILLKGTALANFVYDQIALRPMADIDLLIKPSDATRAIALLLDAGYREGGNPELRPGFDLEFRVEKELLSPQPTTQMVEIHWRLTGPVFASRHIDHAAVWSRAVPVEIETQPTFVLGAVDWLLHQVAHAVYKHRTIQLLDLCDVHYLVLHFGKRMDWDALLKIGVQNHWLIAWAFVMEQAKLWMGTPVPMEVLNAARGFKLKGIDSRLMEWWLEPNRSERQHIIPDWITAPSLSARVRFILAYLAPSRNYIQALYAPQSVWQLPGLYLQRLFREIGHVG